MAASPLQSASRAGELVVFDSANAAIDLFAESETEFVLGKAVASAYDLVAGHHSVHTIQGSLEAGERRIQEIEARLQAAGRFKASAPWETQ
jgi:hypothetical protein